MKRIFRTAARIGTALLALALASATFAQLPATTNSAVQFQAQLSQEFANLGSNEFALDAGWASFQVEGDQLQFQVFLDAFFSGFCGVSLLTDSRQATVQMGTGVFMYVPMCAPVLVPGSDPPAYISCDGLRAVNYFTGRISLNETLLRELATGQGEVYFYMPASAANGSYWDVPPPVKGRLLLVPDGDVTNALAGLPRIPRSLTAVVGTGPVAFSFDELFGASVDVDQDGQADYGLNGRILCTMSIPSDCTSMFGVSCAASNQLLVHGWEALVVPVGTSIGAEVPTNAAWGNPGMDSLTETRSGSCYVPWSGELGRLGEAYLGVKLRRADGDHYGWMRVRLPRGQPFFLQQPFLPDPFGPGGLIIPLGPEPASLDLPPGLLVMELGPVVEDWAYEPAPNMPILAGAKSFPVATSCGGVRRAGYLRMSFSGETGRGYAVQFKPDLKAPGWTSLGWVMISTGSEAALDLPMPGTTGFYRVVEAE